MDERITYCRSCGARCGIVVDVQDNVALHVRGDPLHPLTAGFTCIKGRKLGDVTADPSRFRSCQQRVAGTLRHIATDDAIAAVGAQLRRIMDESGPESIGVYWGTHGVTPALTKPLAFALRQALGTHKWFSTMTIDQAPKWVAPGRIGQWLGGQQRFEDSDVWLFAGTNPPVSMLGGVVTGFPQQNALQQLQRARERGMRLIVVDPRRSELAAAADLHLQIVPGTDAVLFAGLLNVVLVADDLVDHDFCRQHVGDLDAMRAGVRHATPELVAQITGVKPDAIVRAAHIFATAARGMASTGTGANMGPWSNLVEHLTWALNIVCGRFARQGDVAFPPSVLSASMPRYEGVQAPDRSWERSFTSRVNGGWGSIFDELPTPKLPDEILEPGPDRIRALLVIGGNPAASIPDQDKTIRALRSLDLLVSIEPFPTETAVLSHCVLAPTLALERAEHTGPMEYHTVFPFAQYTPAVLQPPADVREDWQYLVGIAGAMGLTLQVLGRTLAPGDAQPTTEDVLHWQTEQGRVPLDDVKQHVHGRHYDQLPVATVGPPREGPGQKFKLLADDVADELRRALTDDTLAPSPEWPHRLIVRRSKHMFNSTGRHVAALNAKPYNPCAMHPADLVSSGLIAGQTVQIQSAHGTILAVVEADDTLRPGAASMTHSFGWHADTTQRSGLDPSRHGSNVNLLLSSDHDIQTINAMPRMTAVPVRIVRLVEESR